MATTREIAAARRVLGHVASVADLPLAVRLWHDRLLAARDAAVAEVGAERFRMWLAYLAGVSGAFADGPLRIYQTVATRQTSGPAPLPPGREDIYRVAAAH